MKERKQGKKQCTWAVKKSQYVAEMRVLRWMSGVAKLDRIRNERIIIRGIAKVGEISKKVQESSLKWYGPMWASVKLGDTLGMPIWLETINGI